MFVASLFSKIPLKIQYFLHTPLSTNRTIRFDGDTQVYNWRLFVYNRQTCNNFQMISEDSKRSPRLSWWWKDGNCLERVMKTLMEYLAIPLPWHPDQPHLAEWQAFSTREILFNLDQSVEARNMAQKQAAKHKSMLAKDGDDDTDAMSKPKIVIEDLGGAPADLDDEDHPEDATVSKHELQI